MQQILSGMSFKQLQDANRLCPFPVKRQLILCDLGFIDGDPAKEDFRQSLCDIGTWTMYPRAVIEKVCLDTLVCIFISDLRDISVPFVSHMAVVAFIRMPVFFHPVVANAVFIIWCV